MKLIKKINLTLLGLLLLTGSVFTYQLNHTSDPVSASAWSGTQTSTEGNYFSSVGSETGEALKLKLRSIISAGTSESYDWSRYEAADEAEGDSSKVLLIYSRQNVAKTAHVSGSVGWNREHSFAKSLFNEQAPAVNDNHHIFADDNKTNSQRGNKPFNELSPSSSTQSIDSYGNLTDNYYTSSYFMPNDLAKGEVARATMYMNTRYGYSITLNFYSIELMLQWHLEHPVTNREIYRNNTVYSLQKNRNPYIDQQDWACKVYSGTNAATQALCKSSLEPVEPTSVTVDPTSASINLGSTLTLNASILPSGANQSLTWTSSNQSVAMVNQGLVTTVGVGQTIITARSVENTTLFATSTITVTNDPIAVSGITLDKESLSLNPGGTSQVNATISPSNASNKAINWTSNNTSVATVSSTGLVSAVGIGNTVITATTVDGGFVDTVDVVVSEVVIPEPVYSFTFNDSGNPYWDATSNFGPYYTSGYGVEKGGGSLTNTQVVSSIPLGSTINVSVAAVTNSTTNTALMTIYGLDKNGTRISSVNGSAYTPSNSSSTLPTQITFARNNIKTINLPVSMTYKIYGLEFNIASADSKTLIVDLDVSYTIGSITVQAEAFANYVNNDQGLGANGACESALTKITSEYDSLTTDAQLYFQNSTGMAFESAKTRIAYLEAWVASNPGVQTIHEVLKPTGDMMIVSIIALIGISSIIGYYLIIRRRHPNSIN